jgi:IclR family acetate operon transcriptional repressor
MSRVQSIARAFDVLASLAEGPRGVTEVAARVGLPKSTVARMLGALALEGAVEQIPGDTRYRLGPRLGALAAGVRPTRRLVSIAHPYLVELARQTGEATGLSVPEGPTMHYVDQVESPNPVQVRDWTGTRIPMHAVSSGQVFLAHFPPPAMSRFLATPLERFTEHTIIGASGLLARLREVRRDGYSWVREEYAIGINSVAAPVADADGEVIGAVHVHGPSYRFPATGADRSIAAEVVEAAATIGARLRA